MRAANVEYNICCVAILAAVSAANVSISIVVTFGYIPLSIDCVNVVKFNDPSGKSFDNSFSLL